MQFCRILFLVLLNVTLFSAVSFAQATLDEFSLTASGAANPTNIVLRGSNFDLTGTYVSQEAFSICSPCRKNDDLQISRNFLAGNVSARGYVNGTYYSQLYLGFGFSFEQDQPAKIPTASSKVVKISAPFKVTGSIGIWQNQNEVGQIDRALFYQSNLNTSGRANVSLRWSTFEIGKLYFDKLVTYRFGTQN